MKYSIVSSDKEGNSYFRGDEVDFELTDFAPPAPPVDLSSYTPVSKLVFFRIPSGWFGDWHPAPKRQFFCCLKGKVELTAMDKEKRIFQAGDVFLLEDTTGRGHQTRVISESDFVAVVVQLA